LPPKGQTKKSLFFPYLALTLTYISILALVVVLNTQERVLLAVLAHPDDETFGMGGTLALYARQGVKVYLVCATRGEVGEVSAELMRGFATPADLRMTELRCAAEKLGLAEVFFLDFRDSGMPGSLDNQHPQALAFQPVQAVAEVVAGHIRRLRPQVVLTFDPIGGYRHPDHIAIHQATVRAFELAAQAEWRDPAGLPAYQAEHLYFQVLSRGFLRAAVFALRLLRKDPRKFGTNGDIDLVSIAEVSFPVHARIDYRPVAKIREQAAACHASQGGAAQHKGIIPWLRRVFSSHEEYMRAFPTVHDKKVQYDLFAE
jgi:N-acetyl-1-D-myo-inositol-2-amino-2-deoxy-alpha-D-glucopyranoside deacetylase